MSYSPDYELIEPSSRKKGDSLRPSPVKQLKGMSKIEKLSIEEVEINNSKSRKNQSNHSSEDVQHSSSKRRSNQISDTDYLLDTMKNSAERKRASAEVRNIKQLGPLLGINKPSRQF